MKLTQEQVIAWAREAGIGWLERAEGISKFLERFSTFAYEAGRKDEREWQGLTDDEINTAAYNNHPLDGIRAFARAVESKLKEKNGF